MMRGTLLSLAALSIPAVFAQIDTMRATIPGSLHQCENTNVFFFQTGTDRPLTLVLVDPSSVPASMQSGTTTLQDIAALNPLQVIEGITAPDASSQNWQVQLANGVAFEAFGFYADSGVGKALSLTRTVTTALPGATNCLGSVQTTISGVAAGATSSASKAKTTSTKATKTSSTATSNTSTGTFLAANTAIGNAGSLSSSSSPPMTTNGAKTNMAVSGAAGFAGLCAAAMVML